jgi:hypothetical protein
VLRVSVVLVGEGQGWLCFWLILRVGNTLLSQFWFFFRKDLCFV